MSELSDLEAGISFRGIKSTWCMVGLLLGKIRDRRLYRPMTFDAYLASKPEWRITRRHADRIIKSARCADEVNKTKLNPAHPNVPNEAVARALSKLPRQQWAAVWAAACEAVKTKVA
jgi:hypothetical protein